MPEPPISETPAPEILQRLQLSQKLFRNAIERLKKHLAKLESEGASPEETAALRLQIMLYGVCLDRTREEAASAAGEDEGARREARSAFYRLMAVTANAQIAADTPLLALPSPEGEPEPHSMGWPAIYAQSHRTAMQQLERLLTL